MDIDVYPSIKQGLSDYFDKLFADKVITKSYYPKIVGFEPANPVYPYIKIDESRNVPYEPFSHRLQRVASLGYKVDIYAKTSGSLSKQVIARTIAKYADNYLNCIKLQQVSWNYVENDGANGEIYHIIMMYSAPYYENRQKIL